MLPVWRKVAFKAAGVDAVDVYDVPFTPVADEMVSEGKIVHAAWCLMKNKASRRG